MFFLWAIVCLFSITSCDQEVNNNSVLKVKDKLGNILMTDEYVMVQPEHIAHIKPKRYQPSLSLYGQLIPSKQIFIQYPFPLQLLEIFVENNQHVAKDDLLYRAIVIQESHNNHLYDNNDQSNSNSNHQINNHQLNKNTQINKNTQNLNNKELMPLVNSDVNNDVRSDVRSDVIAKKNETIEIHAPFSGTIQHSYFQESDVFNSFFPTKVNANQPIMIIRSNDNWNFISLLPEYTKTRISIGQHVSFSVTNKENKLTGQIIDIQPHDNKEILVKVHVLTEKNDLEGLKQGMSVQGKVDFGQINVGSLINESGVHPITTFETYGGLATDLSVFTREHAHVVAPVKAYVWIINHDHKLKRQLVDVISYDAHSKQYTVDGIPSQSLICLASLPDKADGMLLKIL